MIRNLLLIFFLHLTITGFTQQATQYSMYMLNPAQFNPAYAGMEETLNFTGVFRRQWLGLSGSPSQQVLSAHMPVDFISTGIGLTFEGDNLGARQYSNFNLQGNYQLQMGSGDFSIGANVGYVQLNWDGSELRTPDGIYNNGVINHSDDLPINSIAAASVTFGAGVYYKSENLEFGLSANNLTEPAVNTGTISLNLKRHLFFNASYQMDISRLIEIKPALIIKSDLISVQTDFSLMFGFDERFMMGAGIRGYNSESIEGIPIIGGWQLSDQLLLAYSYDISISPLANVNTGSHEIMLKYRIANEIGKGKLPKVIYNPRFL